MNRKPRIGGLARSQKQARAARPTFERLARAGVERLEERKVLAAYINEIYLNPPGGSDNLWEYIELRGGANDSMAGNYLIFIENENSTTTGHIDKVLDLTSYSLGSNGFLVATRAGHPYSVSASATHFTDTGPVIENGGFTAMLIHTTGFVPTVGFDVDQLDNVTHVPNFTNDGLDYPGQGHPDWTILDSIGVHGEAGESDGRLYGKINFGYEATTNIEPDATFVGLGYEIEYLGRYGNSTGQTAADWHASNLTDDPLAGYTGNGDFRQSGDPQGSPTFVETNQSVPYGTNLTNTLGAPNYPVEPKVVGRELFYNRSSFDGNNADINTSDDVAIAIDKSAYLPGDGLAVFENVSSYSRGINGIMIDILGGGDHAAISLSTLANDFVFKVGNNNTPGSWAAAPTPNAISVRPGAGVSGSDRIVITWTDGDIKNQWLEVQVLPTTRTGLTAADVFFWGNKIGDIGSPTATSFSTTAAGDAGPIVSGGLGPAGGITNVRDIDRSNVITAAGDRGAATSNIGAIVRIDIPTGGPFAPEGGGGDAGISSTLAGASSAPAVRSLPVSVANRLAPAAASAAPAAAYFAALDELDAAEADDVATDDGGLAELLEALAGGS